MKTFTTTFAVILIGISSVFASTGSTQESRATVVETRGDIFKVFYTDNSTSPVTILLTDEHGNVLRRDVVRNDNAFMKRYDLSNLKSGKYAFEIKDKQGRITKDVQIQDQADDLVAIRCLCENRYQLLLEQKNGKPVSLCIYNTEGEMIHKESINSKKGFSKVFDLSKFNSENYTFKISDNSSTRIVSVD